MYILSPRTRSFEAVDHEAGFQAAFTHNNPYTVKVKYLILLRYYLRVWEMKGIKSIRLVLTDEEHTALTKLKEAEKVDSWEKYVLKLAGCPRKWWY